MKKRVLIAAALVFAVVVALSLLVPVPSRGLVVEADSSNACKGLERALDNCLTRTGDCSECDHILEQIRRHNCNSGVCHGSSEGGGSATSSAGPSQP